MMSRTASSVKNYLKNLNLFQKHLNGDEEQIRTDIISTRLYLILLLVTVITIVLVAWLRIEPIVITVEQPNQVKFETLPKNKNCPCSKISISYGEFTSIEVTDYHQVCASDFVSDRWIQVLFLNPNLTHFDPTDFRSFGFAQFQALAALCRLSKLNVEQSIASFSLNTLLSPQVFSKKLLQTQMESSLADFKLKSPITFANQLKLVRRMTRANKLMSTLQTNYRLLYFKSEDDSVDINYRASIYNLTRRKVSCEFSETLDDTFQSLTNLSGISRGCLPVSSLLSSTLECFYNQSCVDGILSLFDSKEIFPAMKFNNRSRFHRNLTVQSIVDQLMVENWIHNISYKKYYSQCSPRFCTYTKLVWHSFGYVITKVTSLLSILVLILTIIIPVIVKFMRKYCTRNRARVHVPFKTRLLELITKIKDLAITLNIFKDISNQPSDRQIKKQRYATRIYLFLLIISVGILSTYTWFSESNHYRTVHNPSESEYLRLEKDYSNRLSCSCQTISIPYTTFLSLQPHYHQICSSYLITSEWIRYIDSAPAQSMYVLDFRFHAANQFQMLAMFCEESQQTITNALEIFLQTHLVNSQIIPKDYFISQIESFINEWILATQNQFARTIESIRMSTQANQLMNRLNIFYKSNWTISQTLTTIVEPRTYDDCNCVADRSCATLMNIFQGDGESRTAAHTPRNFFVGCYLIEALMKSTLECFYNKSCMIPFDQYFNPTFRDSLTFPALDATRNSSFERIDSIINRLLVDGWSRDISFTSYYRNCSPSSCTYSFRSQNDLFVVLSTIAGVFGGLSFGFKILIVLILQLNRFSFNGCLTFLKNLCTYTNEQQVIQRLHFLLVTIILAVLYSLTAFNPKSITMQIQKPSFIEYENLSRQYPESLQCSCSHMSIPYNSFFNVTPHFHHICSFNLYPLIVSLTFDQSFKDFYMNMSAVYKYSAVQSMFALVSMCDLSQKTVEHLLNELLNSHFVNSQLLSNDSLHERIQKTFNRFRLTMPKAFQTTMALIRQTTAANMIMTNFNSNWKIIPITNPEHYTLVSIRTAEYENCTCALSSKCFSIIYRIKAGCYILESLLQSTVECFYDQECIDRTRRFTALKTYPNASRYQLNTTLEVILNDLMIEDFVNRTSFENYFHSCSPSLCTYTYINQSNFLDGLTILISLYGGLMIICRVLAYIIVKLFQLRSRTIQPTN